MKLIKNAEENENRTTAIENENEKEPVGSQLI